MRKPKVFISSTIFDLKDLRLAIRYYLEENGFEVIMSEASGFPAQNIGNSYEECLTAIETCQYFILIIGGRVGNLVKTTSADGTEEISITRAEYRKAYSLFSENKIEIVNFVRKEIMDIRVDRKGCEKNLDKYGLSEEMKSEIPQYSSILIENPEKIFDFIDEVSRKEEIKGVNKGVNTEYPKGNWVFQFSDYRDIVSALNNKLDLYTKFEKQIALDNIKEELLRNIQLIFKKNMEGAVVALLCYIDDNVLFESEGKDTVTLTYVQSFMLSMFMPFLYNRRQFESKTLEVYLSSNVFYECKTKEKLIRTKEIPLLREIKKTSDEINEHLMLFRDIWRREQEKITRLLNRCSQNDTKKDLEISKSEYWCPINLAILFSHYTKLVKEYFKMVKDNCHIPIFKSVKLISRDNVMDKLKLEDMEYDQLIAFFTS